MARERIYADFSGGMNASTAVDKLQDNELLLAENVRLDELGNASITGASSKLNTSSYVDGVGNTTVHSIYYNPSIGAVAGVGGAVFNGPNPGSLTRNLLGQNPYGSKMSFASSPGRIYMDVGGTGFFIGGIVTVPVSVDWAPPPSSYNSQGGPSIVGTGIQASGTGVSWTNPDNVVETDGTSLAVSSFSSGGPEISKGLNCLMGTNSFSVSTASNVQGIIVTVVAQTNNGGSLDVSLLKNGISVGQIQAQAPLSALSTLTFGGTGQLWDTTWTPADVNAANFGAQIVTAGGAGITVSLQDVSIAVYGGAAGGMTAAGGAPGVLTGTYSYKATFVAENGEESDGSGDTNQFVPGAQMGTLTAIPVDAGPRTVKRNIYRIGYGTGNYLTAHYLVGTINDNVSTTYADNLTDIAALAEGVILAGDTPGDYPNSRLGSTPVKFPCFHYDRTFWVNQTPGSQNQILWSKPLNGFAYPAVNYVSVGDSKPIYGLVSTYGCLFIIKSDSIWVLSGTSESSFNLTQTLSPVGTDQPYTIALSGANIIFTNARGAWTFNGWTSVPFLPKLNLWYRQQDRTNKSLFGVNGFHPIEVVNTAVTQNFSGTVTPKELYLAYAETGQPSNNAIFVADMATGCITKRPKAVLSLFSDVLTGYVYGGDSLGFIQRLDDWNAQDDADTGAVNMDLQTKYFDLDTRGSNLALWGIEFYINTNGNVVNPYVYYDNGRNSETLASFSTSNPSRVFRKFESENSRKALNVSVRLNASCTNVNSGDPLASITLEHIKLIYDVRSGRARTGQY